MGNKVIKAHKYKIKIKKNAIKSFSIFSKEKYNYIQVN